MLKIPNEEENMTEIERLAGAEVVPELEYHKRMAIKHTAEADKHISLGIEEYIAAGEHLIEVKERMPGEFNAWVDREYGRSLSQANRYMRVARNKHTLLDSSSRTSPKDLQSALKALAAPKETGAERPGKEPTPERLRVVAPDGEILEADNPQDLAAVLGGRVEDIENRLSIAVEKTNRVARDAEDARRSLKERTQNALRLLEDAE